MPFSAHPNKNLWVVFLMIDIVTGVGEMESQFDGKGSFVLK
jgi:hypothetical protein